ncbi:MAG: hypothetical protein F4X20_01260 [Dehalococcoidia bacterium]|nr:hypothetical protein [Dehalococcoidia bacterium]
MDNPNVHDRTPISTTPPGSPYLSGNALVCGDNLDILRELPDESVDLIYLDPPFNSNHDYVAAFGDKGKVDRQLRDIWRWTTETEARFQRLPVGKLRDAVEAVRLVSGKNSPMSAYALFMGLRLVEMHRVLKATGSIYLHCDYRADWLLRILLDKIFGEKNLRNEIVWCYSGGGQPKNDFPRKHDIIFRYSKTGKYLFNRDDVRVPYDSDYQATVFTREDSRAPGKTYGPNKKGKVVEDWWRGIPRPYGEEIVGYPTQKPLALLERIITASSNEGDLVLDPFCGCGTAADAAAMLGRKYLGIDVSAIAVRVMQQRLESRGGDAFPSVYRMGWEDYEWEAFERRAQLHESDSEDGQPGWAWAEDKVAGLLNAVPNDRKIGDGGVDARYYTADDEVIPIQVKMYKGQVGRPELDKLLGVQASWNNQNINSPMSVMVTLYPPRERLRVFAAEQGKVRLRGEEYPRLQVLSVQEMLSKSVRPKLPPVDPRYFVGDTQTRLAITGG